MNQKIFYTWKNQLMENSMKAAKIWAILKQEMGLCLRVEELYKLLADITIKNLVQI